MSVATTLDTARLKHGLYVFRNAIFVYGLAIFSIVGPLQFETALLLILAVIALILVEQGDH